MEFQIIEITKHNIKKYIDDMLTLQDEVDKGLPKDEWYIVSDKSMFIDYAKRGGIILAQFNHDRLTAVSAACTDDHELDWARSSGIIIPGNKIYYHDCVYVDLEFRGNHTQRELMGRTLNRAKAMGYDTIWCTAHPDNIPSCRSIEGIGYKKFAEYNYTNGWVRNVYVYDLTK